MNVRSVLLTALANAVLLAGYAQLYQARGGMPAAQSNAGEILLYAAEALHVVGDWQVVPDATAAGGARLWNPNRGAAKVAAPAANPANYFVIPFRAELGVPYRLWVRAKAENDHYSNDSVYVQFSDTFDAGGAPSYRSGTTSGLPVILEECTGAGVRGWGWTDAGWCGDGPQVRFDSRGPHVLRVQAREDGISLDQIMLSPAAYLHNAPGAPKNDATILPEAGVYTPPPPPSEVVLLADDFNSDQVDTGKWQFGVGAGASPWVPVRQQGGRLLIGPSSDPARPTGENGLTSAGVLDLRGGYASLQVLERETEDYVMLRVIVDEENYYSFSVSGSSLFFTDYRGGWPRETKLTEYDPVEHAYWRIRHDPVSDSIDFETARDLGTGPGPWTGQRGFGRMLPIDAVRVEIRGGGSSTIDNFRAARPQ